MRVREKYLPYGSRKERGLADYIKHRRETGICETCSQEMKTHDVCEACGVLCGSWHDFRLTHYLGHDICEACNQSWRAKERKTGELISFEDFKGHEGSGRPKKRKVKVKSICPPGRPHKVHGEFVLSIKEEKR